LTFTVPRSPLTGYTYTRRSHGLVLVSLLPGLRLLHTFGLQFTVAHTLLPFTPRRFTVTHVGSAHTRSRAHFAVYTQKHTATHVLPHTHTPHAYTLPRLVWFTPRWFAAHTHPHTTLGYQFYISRIYTTPLRSPLVLIVNFFSRLVPHTPRLQHTPHTHTHTAWFTHTFGLEEVAVGWFGFWFTLWFTHAHVYGSLVYGWFCRTRLRLQERDTHIYTHIYTHTHTHMVTHPWLYTVTFTFWLVGSHTPLYFATHCHATHTHTHTHHRFATHTAPFHATRTHTTTRLCLYPFTTHTHHTHTHWFGFGLVGSG